MELLVAAGIDAWTPQHEIVRQISRSKATKRVTLPVVPSIAFADYERVPELVMLSRQPLPTRTVWDEEAKALVSKRVPAFSVFRYLDAYPRVSDRDLDPLRIAEQRGRPKGKGPTFEAGAAVKLSDCGFEGLIGTVQGMKGQYALVTFGDWSLPVKIAAVNLLPAEVAA